MDKPEFFLMLSINLLSYRDCCCSSNLDLFC